MLHNEHFFTQTTRVTCHPGTSLEALASWWSLLSFFVLIAPATAGTKRRRQRRRRRWLLWFPGSPNKSPIKALVTTQRWQLLAGSFIDSTQLDLALTFSATIVANLQNFGLFLNRFVCIIIVIIQNKARLKAQDQRIRRTTRLDGWGEERRVETKLKLEM